MSCTQWNGTETFIVCKKSYCHQGNKVRHALVSLVFFLYTFKDIFTYLPVYLVKQLVLEKSSWFSLFKNIQHRWKLFLFTVSMCFFPAAGVCQELAIFKTVKREKSFELYITTTWSLQQQYSIYRGWSCFLFNAWVGGEERGVRIKRSTRKRRRGKRSKRKRQRRRGRSFVL